MTVSPYILYIYMTLHVVDGYLDMCTMYARGNANSAYNRLWIVLLEVSRNDKSADDFVTWWEVWRAIHWYPYKKVYD